jgi:flagellin-like hook-associated protein FlgL
MGKTLAIGNIVATRNAAGDVALVHPTGTRRLMTRAQLIARGQQFTDALARAADALAQYDALIADLGALEATAAGVIGE